MTHDPSLSLVQSSNRAPRCPLALPGPVAPLECGPVVACSYVALYRPCLVAIFALLFTDTARLDARAPVCALNWRSACAQPTPTSVLDMPSWRATWRAQAQLRLVVGPVESEGAQLELVPARPCVVIHHYLNFARPWISQHHWNGFPFPH